MTNWATASWLLLSTLVVGCASIAVPLDAAPRTGFGPPESQPMYRLQPGDVVELHVVSNPELNEQTIVMPDGRVMFQFAPAEQAAGRTLTELSDRLSQIYRSNRKNDLQVVLRSQVGTRVYVTGEVTLPSEIVTNGQLSALGAVSRAGGLKITAQAEEVVLIRRDEENRPRIYAVNLAAAMQGVDPGADVLLRPYDILYVPRDRFSNASLVFEKLRHLIPFQFHLTYILNQ